MIIQTKQVYLLKLLIKILDNETNFITFSVGSNLYRKRIGTE